MGGCLSYYVHNKTASNNVRIVHMNGLVEDFDPPIFVDQLISSKPPKHFIISPSQLLSPFSKPLNPNDKLEPGQVYFLLPYSTLESDVSPANLTSLAKTLLKKANSTRPGLITTITTPGASPGRSPVGFFEQDTGSVGYRSVKSWRPLLDTINERSFTRRSESDLQDKYPGQRNYS